MGWAVEIEDPSPLTTLVLGALCVGIAATIGGTTGFGSALIAMPLMLLVGFTLPEVVVVNLVTGVLSRLAVAYRLRDRIDWRRVALLGFGSLPGAWLGAETVNLLPAHYVKAVAGAVVMLSGIYLAIPAGGRQWTPSSAAQAATGAVGSYLSTTTSLGGPPPVLLLSRARIPPLSFLADLAGYFIVTNTMSLGILQVRDEIPHAVLWPMLPVFVAAAVVGNVVGLRIAGLLPTKVFRAAVIALVIAAGALTIASS